MNKQADWDGAMLFLLAAIKALARNIEDRGKFKRELAELVESAAIVQINASVPEEQLDSFHLQHRRLLEALDYDL